MALPSRKGDDFAVCAHINRIKAGLRGVSLSRLCVQSWAVSHIIARLYGMDAILDRAFKGEL